jgi:protein TonB
MMHGKVAAMLRSYGLIGLACCAVTVGPGIAVAADSPAHVDSTQQNAEPIYPDSARAAGEAGTILLDVEIKSTGRAAKYKVSQSSGYGDLDEAAVETVLNWHFVPATRDGDAITDWTTVKIVYQLPQTADKAAPAQ